MGPVFNVQAFGAVGDGMTDDTAAFQAAVNAGPLTYIPIPPVGYKIAGQVVVSGNYRSWIQETGAEIRDYNTGAACIKFAGVSGQMSFLVVRGLRTSNYFGAHRIPSVQFGDSNGIAGLLLQDLFFNGRDVSGDFLTFLNAFNIRLDGLASTSAGGGVPIVMHANATNTGNIEFANVTSAYAPIGMIINDAGPGATGSQNLLNSVVFSNYKMVRDTPLTNTHFSGTIGAIASAAATSITVNAGEGSNYAAGDWVVISSASGNNVFVDKVASVAGDVLTLALSSGLPFSLAVGDFIVNSKWAVVAGQNVRNLTLIQPHLERANGVIGLGIQSARMIQPLIGASCFRGFSLLRGCQNCIIDGPYASGGSGTGVVILHQYNEANNTRNAVHNVSALSAMSPSATPTQVDGGSFVFVNERMGGQQTLLGIWHQDTTVAANQTNVQLIGPQGNTNRGYRSPSFGLITKLHAITNSSRIAGTLTATLYRDGSPTALTAVIDGTNPFNSVTEQFFAQGAIQVAKGQMIDVRVTTDGSWSPTSNFLDVAVWAEF
jgi:hypothetical protein